jgi:hypothetical protein
MFRKKTKKDWRIIKMDSFIMLQGQRIPVRSNEPVSNKIPLLVSIDQESYEKLIRKAALEGISQDEIVQRLINLLDDKHKMENYYE